MAEVPEISAPVLRRAVPAEVRVISVIRAVSAVVSEEGLATSATVEDKAVTEILELGNRRNFEYFALNCIGVMLNHVSQFLR